jgi:hypothetical protein
MRRYMVNPLSRKRLVDELAALDEKELAGGDS